MKHLLLISLLFFNIKVFSQSLYGNEWIKPGQKYLKTRISEKGVYRINYNQLQATGFLSGNINPKGIQIFYLGKELPLHIEGEQDNTFDNADYIEFYAEPTNGKFDESLYKTGEHPNVEVSLFEDEAVYFITYNANNSGLRYVDTSLNSTGLTPDNFVSYTSSLNFSNQYYPGRYVLDVMTFSDYIEGEGYFGDTFSIGGSQVKTINTPNFYTTSNFRPFFESFVAGRSNASSTNAFGNNHHLRLTVGGIAVKDTTYRGYKTIKVNQYLTNSSLNSTTDINFTSVNDLGALTDFQAPAYARITYPRSLDGSTFNSLLFKVINNNSSSLLNFYNTSQWTDAYILDPTNIKRYKSSKNGSINSFTVNTSTNSLFLYNSAGVKSLNLETTTFAPINANTFNAKMLLVTHQSLITAVNELAAYKNSKGISTEVINIDDLYNQFSYGIHHPLAIRNLSRYLIENASIKPEFLFLVGKGYEYSKQMLSQDLVPTMGFPPSDNEFTAKIIDNTLAPALATGRLPAKNIEDVNDYLEKLKLFEQQPNEIWRKTIINITGGGNSSEDSAFSNYLRNLSSISDKDFFGSATTSYYKSVTDPITSNLTDKINKTIEDGANLVTYLGHGSTTGTAVSVGKAEDIQRILFFFINGCSTGNAFTTASLGEEFVLQKQRGAIGWIGTSSEGVASYLYGLGNAFYQNSFKTNYGKSVAYNISQSIRSYQNQNDDLNKIHCQQYIFLGDPSLSFYAPDKPDYQITSSDISIADNGITANSSEFNLSLIVKNNGKALPNTVKVNVVRTLSDNTTITYDSQSYNNLFNTDTLKFNIKNDVLNGAGNNKFTVKIDPLNEIDELNKLNNTADFTYYFPSNGITVISPNQYSIVTSQDLELKIQSNNLFTEKTNYIFEIDTNINFDSGWKKTSGSINSGLFATWKPNISLEQNKVYYWRAKLDTDINNGGQWQSSSFTYIANSGEGWNQGHPQQFSNIALKNITNQFNFTETVYPVRLSTRGQSSTTTNERRIRVGAGNTSLSFRDSEFSGICLVAIDPIVNTKIFNYASQYNFKNNGVNGTGVFYFNTNLANEVDSMIFYLNAIPANFNVLGISGLNFNPKNLKTEAKNALKTLGISLFEDVENGEPYVFVGKKGLSINNNFVKEIKASMSEDIVHLHDLPYPWSNGTYTSEKVGPAQKWHSASVNFNSTPNDVLNYSIIGIDASGLESILRPMTTNPNFDLSNINADTYPYLKITTSITDNTDFTAPKLSSWKVLYDAYPEVTFNPEFKNSFYASELQEGDSLKVNIGISNLKSIPSDSLIVNYKITTQNRNTISGIVDKQLGLLANNNTSSSFTFPTTGISGNNILQLSLSTKNAKDQLSFNNFINYNFKVIKDDRPPILDLMFDGKHIVNGETVSSKPNITISVSDENKFLLLKDTSAIKVFIKSPLDDNYKRLSFSSNKIAIQNIATSENNKAVFLVQPGVLNDGIYTLKISAVDNSENTIINDYTIDFEIVNQQTVSNFLVYPNPVTTSARFVFKLTGEKVPDKIKIQIMSQTGKIVKEINKDDLGNIHIGNNITDYTWDGTDMFGDRLANGVYFYKVTIQNNDGSSIKNNYNSTNKMFKNNLGKIYLLK